MFEGGGPVFPKTVKNDTDAGRNLDICASFEINNIQSEYSRLMRIAFAKQNHGFCGFSLRLSDMATANQTQFDSVYFCKDIFQTAIAPRLFRQLTDREKETLLPYLFHRPEINVKRSTNIPDGSK